MWWRAALTDGNYESEAITHLWAEQRAWADCLPRPQELTVAVVEEVGDGGGGAAAPGFGGVDGGEDGGHEPLVAAGAESLLAEFGVVVGQTQQVAWDGDGDRERLQLRDEDFPYEFWHIEFKMLDGNGKWQICFSYMW